MSSSKKNQATVVSAERQHTIISGPLPPPELLQRYERLTPGAVEVILDMAQEEQRSRLKLNEATHATIDRDNKDERAAEKRGQWMAFTLVLVAIMAALLMSYWGNHVAGAILAGAPLASVLAKIITRK